jgi:hypothetical protein
MKKLALVVFALFALGTTPLLAQAAPKPENLPTKSVCPPGKKMCGGTCIAASLKCDESAKARAQHEQNMAKAKKDKAAEEKAAKAKAEKEAAEKAQKCPPKTKRCSYGCIPADKKCTDGSDAPAPAAHQKKKTKQEQMDLLKNYKK